MATVLVVEDEEIFRTSVEAMLRGAGHTVVTASNGFEGLALFRSSPDRFDLILTDLEMPIIDGHQLINLIRETNARMRIICMGGSRDNPIPPNTEFLPKPSGRNSLAEALFTLGLYECVDKLLRIT